ncbi:MAG TPA: SGNH/GDSL hydrolase family protein [Desulfomonilia bacterium]|nr:SGNH/GDSL hydrolase family protein [Desulfomonilia bacterium]
MKLLVRGGSIAAGVGVTLGYVDILKKYCSAGNIEVINRSGRGENSFDGIRTFHDDIEPAAPEILVIHFGVDDAFFPVYRSEFKENLVRMVRPARELFSPVILMPTSHTFDDPYEMDAINIYYRTIREVCMDLDCEMVPVHTYWAGYLQEQNLTNSDLVQKDARLPNERGHEVFASAIGRAIERHLL